MLVELSSERGECWWNCDLREGNVGGMWVELSSERGECWWN